MVISTTVAFGACDKYNFIFVIWTHPLKSAASSYSIVVPSPSAALALIIGYSWVTAHFSVRERRGKGGTGAPMWFIGDNVSTTQVFIRPPLTKNKPIYRLHVYRPIYTTKVCGHPFKWVDFEIIVDYRKRRTEQAPILIEGAVVEQVESFKFLGVHITNKLEWSKHTKTVVEGARQSLFPLRKLKGLALVLRSSKGHTAATSRAWLHHCLVWQLLRPLTSMHYRE